MPERPHQQHSAHHRTVMFVSSGANLIGGAEHCFLDVAVRMQASSWRPIAVVPSEGPLSAALRSQGVAVEVVPLGILEHSAESRSPILLLRLATAAVAAIRLRRLIHRYRVDLVHSNTADVIAGALGARLAGVPHVWHVRELLTGPAWRPLQWALHRYASRIVCITDAVADHTTEARPRPDRLVVIRDGIDLALFHPASGETRATQVIMLGRISPWKRQLDLIRAAGQVAAGMPEATFHLIGECLPVYEDLRRELLREIDELGLTGRVTIEPGVSRDGAAARLREAAVAVVPSAAEPGGLVVFEAMASGVPVIATDTGGPREVIDHGVNGFLYSPGDTGRLACLIEKLLTDPDLHARVSDAGLRRAREDFDLELHIRRLIELYDDVVSTPRRTDDR